ncbi:MAG: PRC-barrel domain-containing protein [Thermoplasmata archaeon]
MSAQSIFGKVKESLWPGKRKIVGLPVYLEENGEVLGKVSDIVEAKDGKILSYVLENEVSSFQIPVENVLVTKRGLIYIPSWYTDADKFIRTLEIQEALTPEVFMVLAEENVPKEQMKKILDKATPETKHVIQEGLQLLEATQRKLAGFKKESARIYSLISEMTEKRVLGVIDRMEFAKNILELKRKAQIVEASMRKASEIISRLESSALLRVARELESKEQKTEKAEAMPLSGAPQISAEQRAKIKKFRVLKVEKELKEMEEKLRASEQEFAKRVKEEVEKVLAERENMLRGEFVKALDVIEKSAASLTVGKLSKEQKAGVEALLKEIKIAKNRILAEQKAKQAEAGKPGGATPDHERNICPLCGAVFEKEMDICPVCGLKYEPKEEKEKRAEEKQAEKKVVKKKVEGK